MLSFLHQKFDFEQRKALTKAVFDKIYVKDREIVDVELNPPFAILLRKDLERLFKNHPSPPTKEDVFEHIIDFTLSEQYAKIKLLVKILLEKAKV
jgi:hypothetical protein